MNRDSFLAGTGDRWFLERQLVDSRREDWVHKGIEILKLNPSQILEVGCGDGWRLSNLKKRYPSCNCCGVDPSGLAIMNAPLDIMAQRGTAQCLPYVADQFDIVIYGFCLYCCDREDLFRIAAEGDRLVKKGGHIIIEDFYPEFPQYNVCPDDTDIMTYKMNYGNLWSWHPAYEMVFRNVIPAHASQAGDKVAVQIFHKKGCK
jgi:ubiquinone/menaquinone biosynthesis C-methylase UbiE